MNSGHFELSNLTQFLIQRNAETKENSIESILENLIGRSAMFFNVFVFIELASWMKFPVVKKKIMLWFLLYHIVIYIIVIYLMWKHLFNVTSKKTRIIKFVINVTWLKTLGSFKAIGVDTMKNFKDMNICPFLWVYLFE